MTERECNEAGKALMQWFRSQGIRPADALEVVVMLVANAVDSLSGDDGEMAAAWRHSVAGAVLRGKVMEWGGSEGQ